MAIGQAGSLSESTPKRDHEFEVKLDAPLDDPVIVLTATNAGGQRFNIRVTDREVDPDTGEVTGFSFKLDEWAYHDGGHVTETFNWIAVEEGTHELPDGRIIEAQHVKADSTARDVEFSGKFTEPPVVLTNVMSVEDATPVASDAFDITAKGFRIALEEEDRNDGVHGGEHVGVIAVQAGTGDDSGAAGLTKLDHNWQDVSLGETFDDPITVAATQTQNDGDASTVVMRRGDDDSLELRVEEEYSVSKDLEVETEVVGTVSFERGLILCFTPQTLIGTPHGPRPVETLQPGDLVLTRDHGPQPLRWCYRRDLSGAELHDAPDLRPLRISASPVLPCAPSRPTLVSPQHRVLISGARATLLFGAREVLVPAKALLAKGFAEEVIPGAGVSYIHLLFDRHEIIEANGAPMESLHTGDMAFGAVSEAGRAELSALFPDLPAGLGRFEPARPLLARREAELLVG